VVNEINHTMGFHSAQPVSGVDIADEIVNYVVEVAKNNLTPAPSGHPLPSQGRGLGG
jgi:hypothetical protein